MLSIPLWQSEISSLDSGKCQGIKQRSQFLPVLRMCICHTFVSWDHINLEVRSGTFTYGTEHWEPFIHAKNTLDISCNFEASRNITFCSTYIFTKGSLYLVHIELRIVNGIIHMGFIAIELCE